MTARSPRAPIEVRSLSWVDHAAAARVLTDAFLDDPAWVGIGPDRPAQRRLVLRGFHHAELAKAASWGGVSYVAAREGTVLGVAVSFAGDRWPVPEPWATLYDVPAFLLAGAASIRRAQALDAAFHRHHPAEPHVYLELLAVAPWDQRTGVGGALLRRVLAEAGARGLPVYLETTQPANVPYYAGHGFEVRGEAPLPRGAAAWFMSTPERRGSA